PVVISFALIFAPFWFFGFGAAEPRRRALDGRGLRVAAAGALVLPYLAFALPLHVFRWEMALGLLTIAVVVAALLESIRNNQVKAKLAWQDVAALAVIAVPILYAWFRPAWPYAGLGGFPKLLFTDVALYGFLGCRALATTDVGYDFRPRWRDVAIGLREWAFFFPFAVIIGLALHFIKFHANVRSLADFAGAWLVTFFLVAVPEEIFFRGLLLNLLETRLSRNVTLAVSAVLFGLSHYNKGALFNWRYV